MRRERGFTLVELTIVVVILGMIAAIAIPDYGVMRDRAKEGATKANMHAVQVAAEDFAVQHRGAYAADMASFATMLPATFSNPFDRTTGAGRAWEDRAVFDSAPSARPGLASYADSATTDYNVKGWGRSAELSLVLTSGQW